MEMKQSINTTCSCLRITFMNTIMTNKITRVLDIWVYMTNPCHNLGSAAALDHDCMSLTTKWCDLEEFLSVDRYTYPKSTHAADR